MREHHSAQAGFHPWDEFELKERQYYKLLARFGEKGPDGRYALDDAVKASIRDHVREVRRREAARDILRRRGFGDAAARKWLQRHSLDEILTAKPRRPRGVD